MTKRKNVYRALTGLDYRHADTGEYMRVEAGDRVEGLNELAEKTELAAKNIEPWEEKEGETK